MSDPYIPLSKEQQLRKLLDKFLSEHWHPKTKEELVRQLMEWHNSK